MVFFMADVLERFAYRISSGAAYLSMEAVFVPLHAVTSLRCLNLTLRPDCFANQYVVMLHSDFSDVHSRSKKRKICGMNLPISMIEIFFPMHVLDPYPNYTSGISNPHPIWSLPRVRRDGKAPGDLQP
jgi:hypothetical protein